MSASLFHARQRRQLRQRFDLKYADGVRFRGNDDGGQDGPHTATLAIDVSNHFLAALVLEVDIDIGRLIVLA